VHAVSQANCAVATYPPSWQGVDFQVDGAMSALDCVAEFSITVMNDTDDLIYIKDIITDGFNNAANMIYDFSITPKTNQSLVQAQSELQFVLTVKYRSELAALPAQTDFSGQFHLVMERAQPPLLLYSGSGRNLEIFRGSDKLEPHVLRARFAALDDVDGNITNKIKVVCSSNGSLEACPASWTTAQKDEYNFSYQVTNSLGLAAAPIDINVQLWDFVKLASGIYHTALLTSNGNLFTWGFNSGYRLGVGDNNRRLSPTQVDFGGKRIVDAAACNSSGHAVDADGNLYSWGSNGTRYALGTDSASTHSTPYKIAPPSGEKYVQVSCFYDTGAALTDAGNVYTWGWEGYGATGHGQDGDKKAPTKVPELSNIVKIKMGQYNGGAIDADGNLFVWGTNLDGQLGAGNAGASSSKKITTYYNKPRNYPSLTGVKDICFGTQHAIAVMNDGRVLTWGSNSFGRLGNGGGGTTNSYKPYTTSIQNGMKCSASSYGSFVVTTDGKGYGFGSNNFGEFGTGGTNERLSSPTLAAIDGLTDAALQYDSGHVLEGTTGVWGFGYNGNGELGIGTSSSTATPTLIDFTYDVKEW
jgi:alpha-tubulin suppressor-like RCC1 family protein